MNIIEYLMNSLSKKLLFYVFIAFSISNYCQNSNETINSLSNKSFDELTALFYDSKPDTLKATFYAEGYLKKALLEKDTMEMVVGKSLISAIKNNNDIFLRFCDSLIEIINKKPSKNFPTAIHLKKIKNYFVKEEDGKAQKELLLANIALKKNRNDSLQALIDISTAYLKNRVNQKQESIELLKSAYQYALKNNYLLNGYSFLGLPINISSAYIDMNLIDSSEVYYKKALKLYFPPDKYYFLQGHLNLTKARIEFKKKQFSKSIIYLKKAIKPIIDDEYFEMLTRVYCKLGINYDSIGNKNDALKYHLKADSLYSITKIKRLDLIDSYEFLLKKAKKENNLKNQLLYTERLLEIKEFNLTEKNKISTTFTNEYDIPNLEQQKEKLKAQIENEKTYKILFLCIIAAIVVLLGFQIKKKLFYRKQFEKIIQQKELLVAEKVVEHSEKPTQKISDDIVNAVLDGLTLFEKNNDFLDANINLSNLANALNTNNNYLSKIINQHKNTSFTNYINQLRINHTVERLKNDALLRKYTVKAIASEMGYKNVESFSKAFYKFTKLKPSYFIKELEKTT